MTTTTKTRKIEELTKVLNNINNALANWGEVYQLNAKNWNSGTEDDYYRALTKDADRLTSEIFALKFQA